MGVEYLDVAETSKRSNSGQSPLQIQSLMFLMLLQLVFKATCSGVLYTSRQLNRQSATHYMSIYGASPTGIGSVFDSHSSSRLYSNNPYKDESGVYLERMVQRKKIEVDRLLRNHQSYDDPLFMRMTYIAAENKFLITKSIRRDGEGVDQWHKMSVMVDVKRRSPTVPHQREVVDYSSAGRFVELLARAGADAFLINAEDVEYGGREEELRECVLAVRAMTESLPEESPLKKKQPPACILKDLIIHPIQIAQAVERGASGVLLITAVVGADLEALLDSCSIMGIEPIVEVHTPSELNFALKHGATIFIVNMWDRMTGKLHEQQAQAMIGLMPMNAVAMAAGNIQSLDQVIRLGMMGYDGVVLGRHIAEVPDIKKFFEGVHAFTGPPRAMGMGMKSLDLSKFADNQRSITGSITGADEST